MNQGIAISLVIPVRDEEATIDRLLDSIEEQVRQPDEVVIVDGGSTDGTRSAIKRRTAHDPRYNLIEGGPGTPGQSRNVGIACAARPWVALTDAGIRLDPHWLDRLARMAEADDGIDVVFGSFEAARGSFFERCADVAYVAPRARSPVGPVRGRSVASCLLRRDVWSQAGGFPDLRAAEDLIFIDRVEALGARITTAPEARVIWSLQPTPWRTFQRFRRYSTHNVRAGQQHRWHHGVARLYLGASVLALLGRVTGLRTAPILALAGGARVGRTIWRRREGRGAAWALRPDRFVTVAGILLLVDLATFVGWAEARLPAARRPGRT